MSPPPPRARRRLDLVMDLHRPADSPRGTWHVACVRSRAVGAPDRGRSVGSGGDERSMRRTSLLLTLLALACATTKSERADSQPPSEYRIGREDVLEIVVWHEPELTRLMPVRPDGFIALPLAGEIEAAGKTPAELRDQITRALTPYVKDAAVAVLVREINGPRFSVLGEVAKAGTYPLRGAISVTQALATAGG